MVNFIASIILLAIAVFVISLFPAGKEFIGNITDTFTEKKGNVVEEYERVKGEVEDITETVTETKEKVEKTIDTVSGAVDTASETLDKVNELLGDDEDDEECWRTSDPEIDPSIEAGRTNYNFADPGEDGLNEDHLEMDIKPWIEWGNRGNDTTTKEERIAALAITEKGREILDILGYQYD